MGAMLYEIEDIDALLECIKLNFSTYSKPHNRGRGLDNILSIVNSNSGKFTLASGKAAIQKSKQQPTLPSALFHASLSQTSFGTSKIPHE